MGTIKSLAIGAFYLVSGVYSVGFSMFIDGLMKPVSGSHAYVMAPDALFPYEVTLFALFGVTFFIAAFLQFRSILGVEIRPLTAQT
jgi:hypothetical protein